MNSELELYLYYILKRNQCFSCSCSCSRIVDVFFFKFLSESLFYFVLVWSGKFYIIPVERIEILFLLRDLHCLLFIVIMFLLFRPKYIQIITKLHNLKYNDHNTKKSISSNSQCWCYTRSNKKYNMWITWLFRWISWI